MAVLVARAVLIVDAVSGGVDLVRMAAAVEVSMFPLMDRLGGRPCRQAQARNDPRKLFQHETHAHREADCGLLCLRSGLAGVEGHGCVRGLQFRLPRRREHGVGPPPRSSLPPVWGWTGPERVLVHPTSLSIHRSRFL